MGLMAMLSGPVIFLCKGVVMASGGVIFMCAVVGMSIEARFTGPVMVTGCCRLTGDVMLTLLVVMFISAVTVTILLMLPLWLTAEVTAVVTGVVVAELLSMLFAPVSKKTDQSTYLAGEP